MPDHASAHVTGTRRTVVTAGLANLLVMLIKIIAGSSVALVRCWPRLRIQRPTLSTRVSC
jgi:hypothetical protein